MTISHDTLVILVTGAVGGIDQAISAGLKTANASVIVTDLAAESDVTAEMYFSHDITMEDDWVRFAVAVEVKYSRLDGIVTALVFQSLRGLRGRFKFGRLYH